MFKVKAFISVLMLSLFAFSTSYSVSTPESFVDIAEKATPAVVNISTTYKIKLDEQYIDLNDLLRNPWPFFERGEQGEMDKEPPRIRSLGSGFIIDPEGYIVTNYHVVEKAEEIKVKVGNQEKEYTAKIVGYDRKTDLALLKIDDGNKFPFLEFGDSDNSKVGEWVLTIGNPFGLGGTVTAGVISAKSRALNIGYDDFIQTDASINPGNSGGPMIDMKGKVIGVNNLIYSTSKGGNIGIGFVIPSSIAKPIIEVLKKDGKIVRSWLGVTVQKMTLDIAEKLHIDTNNGVILSSIMKGGPAEKAGLMVGDILTKFNGHNINNSNAVKIIAQTPVGKKVEAEVIRNGKRIIVEVTTEASKEEDMLGAINNSKAKTYYGIKVGDITDNIRKKFNISDSINGVVVTEVQRGSMASLAGVVPGVVILKVNNQTVSNLKEFEAAMEKVAKSKDKAVLFLLYYNGISQFIVLKEE